MRYNPLEAVPVVGPVDPAVLAGDIRRAYPLTFKFSQGDPGVQRNLSHLTTATCVHMYTPQGFAEALPEALEQAEVTAHRVRPPRHHVPFSDAEIQKEGVKQWEKFRDILEGYSDGKEMSRYEYWSRIRFLNIITPIKDTKHTLLGRTQYHYSGRRHDSYYRRFIMEGESVNSQPFDVIFSAMRYGFMRHRHPIPFLGMLKTAWEYHNPGESFVSDRFREDLEASGSWYARRALTVNWPGGWVAKKILPTLTEVVTEGDLRRAQQYKEEGH